MYLRSLAGPEGILYMFYDDPELIHIMMRKWFEVSDAVLARHQKYVEFDEVLFDEDICYNGGPLISYEMMDEFLFPYYQQLLQNVQKRSAKKPAPVIKNAAGENGSEPSRAYDRKAAPPYVYYATDGETNGIIPVCIKKFGANVFGPNEVASNNDVVEIGRRHEDIVLTGGIDKRILASDKEQIDRHLDYILPAMRKRGGFIPTCDHGVPEEVSFENYLHYRKRVAEYGS
jgi:uroporphyrinogen-III decarboxylase